jgi:hypothetical protein
MTGKGKMEVGIFWCHTQQEGKNIIGYRIPIPCVSNLRLIPAIGDAQ